MTVKEAKEYAKTMTFREAVNNLTYAKCIPYRKATFIKIYELLDIIEPKPSGLKADTLILDEEAFMNLPKEMFILGEQIKESEG